MHALLVLRCYVVVVAYVLCSLLLLGELSPFLCVCIRVFRAFVCAAAAACVFDVVVVCVCVC